MLLLSKNALTHISLITPLLVTYVLVSRAQLKIWILFKNTPADRLLLEKTFTDHDWVKWRKCLYRISLAAIGSIVTISNFVSNSWIGGIVDNIYTLLFLFPAFVFTEMIIGELFGLYTPCVSLKEDEVAQSQSTTDDLIRGPSSHYVAMVLPRTIRREPGTGVSALSQYLRRFLPSLIISAVLCVGAFRFHLSVCIILLWCTGVYFTVRGNVPKKSSGMRDALKHTLYLGLGCLTYYLIFLVAFLVSKLFGISSDPDKPKNQPVSPNWEEVVTHTSVPTYWLLVSFIGVLYSPLFTSSLRFDYERFMSRQVASETVLPEEQRFLNDENNQEQLTDRKIHDEDGQFTDTLDLATYKDKDGASPAERGWQIIHPPPFPKTYHNVTIFAVCISAIASHIICLFIPLRPASDKPEDKNITFAMFQFIYAFIVASILPYVLLFAVLTCALLRGGMKELREMWAHTEVWSKEHPRSTDRESGSSTSPNSMANSTLPGRSSVDTLSTSEESYDLDEVLPCKLDASDRRYVTEALLERVADWKGCKPDIPLSEDITFRRRDKGKGKSLGTLRLYGHYDVVKGKQTKHFYVYLFSEAIVCVAAAPNYNRFTKAFLTASHTISHLGSRVVPGFVEAVDMNVLDGHDGIPPGNGQLILKGRIYIRSMQRIERFPATSSQEGSTRTHHLINANGETDQTGLLIVMRDSDPAPFRILFKDTIEQGVWMEELTRVLELANER